MLTHTHARTHTDTHTPFKLQYKIASQPWHFSDIIERAKEVMRCRLMI